MAASAPAGASSSPAATTAAIESTFITFPTRPSFLARIDCERTAIGCIFPLLPSPRGTPRHTRACRAPVAPRLPHQLLTHNDPGNAICAGSVRKCTPTRPRSKQYFGGRGDRKSVVEGSNGIGEYRGTVLE